MQGEGGKEIYHDRRWESSAKSWPLAASPVEGPSAGTPGPVCGCVGWGQKGWGGAEQGEPTPVLPQTVHTGPTNQSIALVQSPASAKGLGIHSSDRPLKSCEKNIHILHERMLLLLFYPLEAEFSFNSSD